MFIIRIGGGLGNQMFQYAFAKAYSLKNNVSVFLDTTAFAEDNKIHPTNRKFKLEFYNTTLTTQSNIPFWAKLYSNRYCRKLHDSLFASFILKDQESGYKPQYLELFSKKVFDGYFQSPKYFEKYREILIQEFTLKNQDNSKLNNFIERLQSENSVAVHIRRGDYLLAKNTSIHGVLSLEYYGNAIEYFEKNITDVKFYIFSDDIPWCQSIWKDKLNFSFIDNQLQLSDLEEMKLMSTCKHQIIANSSFSWWAAWLNINPNKKVIAPKNWFADKKRLQNWDIYPEEWIKI